jgi:polyketide cyclase/dehydrase/lipid transport protein
MKTKALQFDAYIENAPETVMAYIADVRNRPFFLPSLKSVSDLSGDTLVPGSTWRWRWVALGIEFEGMGHCLAYEPGREYAFRTEGGIGSTWTYRATAERTGTRLRVDIQYEAPPAVLGRLPSEAILEPLRRSEASTAIHNLKSILDR